MLLAVHCSWEGRKKMGIIRLSVQSEPHGSGCTSLEDTFMGSDKKARKPCRVTYSGGYSMKSHGLHTWLTIMTQNQDLSFAEVPFVPCVLDWCWQATVGFTRKSALPIGVSKLMMHNKYPCPECPVSQWRRREGRKERGSCMPVQPKWKIVKWGSGRDKQWICEANNASHH